MKYAKLCLFILLAGLTSCISTKDIPDGDQLFVGISKITYDDDTVRHLKPQPPTLLTEAVKRISRVNLQHLNETKSEVEVALATVPNGALFGSSYYHVPFSWRLWVYNKYGGKNSKFARWMTKSFGKPPVLISQVNPALRASVAQSVLRNNGYFHASVTYEPVALKNPKKSKIAYHVHLDSLFTFDSIAYVGFPEIPRRLIDSTAAEAIVHKDEPFSVSALERERSRIGTLLRNNGYYYFNPSYTTYLADTLNVPYRTQLRIQLADGLPEEAMKQWYIGHTNLQLRRSMRETITDSLSRRSLHIFWGGNKKNPPIRPRVLLKNMRLRPRQLFSYEKYQETATKINATGVFSSVDFQFTPRDKDTLDLRLNCTFDKPYDFYFETTLNGRTIGRSGPEVKIGFTKRNAFKGGEKLDVNLHGSYEWQKNASGNMNTYQYGADASIEFPRIIAPFINSDRVRRDENGRPKPRKFFSTPTTLAKMSFDIVNRPDFYRMHIAGGEWTYNWQSSEQSRHEFSPLTVKYQFINTRTKQFQELLDSNLYLASTMEDQFITKMRYTYTYTSPTTLRNPIRWETTIAEAGNAIALWDLIGGHDWNEKGKTLFRNKYAQFLRIETDFTKTWRLGSGSSLVGHLNAGYIFCYGNSTEAPFSEMFYVGGANSIRAFRVHGIGPGRIAVMGTGRQTSSAIQNGDMKLVANLEYRPRLFGNLEGAIFLDAGNVWLNKIESYDENEIRQEYSPEEAEYRMDYMNQVFDAAKFYPSRFFDQLAVGTGFGLRYNLGFLVVRIDWGIALHLPYYTSRSGYFNIDSFKDAHTLHFAIGYPF